MLPRLAEHRVRLQSVASMRAFVSVLVRDLAIGAATLALLVLDARSRASGDEGASAMLVGAAAGAMLTITAFLAHEWGHWIGAVASGGRVSRPPRISPYLFFYDTAKSTRAQFLWMSAGGYLATALCVPAIVAWADLGSTSGRVYTS